MSDKIIFSKIRKIPTSNNKQKEEEIEIKEKKPLDTLRQSSVEQLGNQKKIKKRKSKKLKKEFSKIENTKKNVINLPRSRTQKKIPIKKQKPKKKKKKEKIPRPD
ncbi:hypothetical protein ACFL2K_03795, partial [Candidatus Margulisiibacteriota bacterium]